MRKIVQIETDPHDNVMAICDDGSLWLLLGDQRREDNPLRWQRCEWPEIPQDGYSLPDDFFKEK